MKSLNEFKHTWNSTLSESTYEKPKETMSQFLKRRRKESKKRFLDTGFGRKLRVDDKDDLEFISNLMNK
ncbi:hypothetical protein PVK64_17880 [Aliivibrio sp. S4TY2]|uniref:hypothetical protein n=1 Tax=unclassified Aliivibrio TaxID=2645654 RepID=UPI0023781636|nr:MULTISPECIES: hypothetical protein [unclassified Aliivibrio]MDD9158036.1 hypothetical protein [Aliivibrio sp. S4TY2]MDD9161921.1 hypothetical protein [Aliivibrio sp. S4TY1]MDD9166033.1 hypothetical protein [Aliivibrio sp. S4MY2]MDD9170001.1 hypothetical protein [Aliivibrio sp. S4MY4]MDD9187052.1 hypothetical protein [Aliivibrio sp. S4MY3]